VNIHQRISKVMEDVRYLCKDDDIQFGNTRYKAISEEKVTRAVREKLIEYGITIIPCSQTHTREAMVNKEGKHAGYLTTVDMTYMIVNVDDPTDYVTAVSSGTGVDTQDKGVGKAMTYAYKYLLLRVFAIPTGEDPDKISSAELDEKQQSKSKENRKSDFRSKLIKYAEEKGISQQELAQTYNLDRTTTQERFEEILLLMQAEFEEE